MLIFFYELFVAIMLFGLGASITSFMIALIYRLESGIPYPRIFTEGSSCEECKKELKWYELIPVLSFILFKGKCKRCGFKIPYSYPILEFVLGITYSLLYLKGFEIEIYVIATMLYFLALYDFYHMGFPKFIVHIFLILAFVYRVISLILDFDISQLYSLLIAVILGVLILLLNRFKESFGSGDILVFLLLGILMEMKYYPSMLIISIMSGAIVGLFLIIIGKISIKGRLPFVPFIWVGFILSFWLQSYISHFFATYISLW